MGIGARITAIFGLGALLLSLSMGGLSYFTTRHFLLGERETAAQNQAFANAVLVRSSLSSVNAPRSAKQYAALLSSLDGASNSHSILVHKSTPYYPSSLSVGEAAIPAGLRDQALKGNAATQTYISGSKNRQPEIAVGVPIPSVKATYFEVFSLSDLGHTLRVLSLTLISTGVVTTVLGIALGRFARRRSLRPLTDVSQAAVAIARGRLDTRLETDAADPDLEGLTSSFNTMVDQLQARIQREARFNSDVSHELRSPLTTLSASLEVLETDHDNLPPRAQRALQLLGEDLRRFQRMVGDLLEMSRADAGSADVFLEEVNVSELVERAVENGLRSLGETASTPRMVIEPDVRSLHIGVDKRRFERVMANLLENAANYAGGATVVSISTGGGAGGGRGTIDSGEEGGPGASDGVGGAEGPDGADGSIGNGGAGNGKAGHARMGHGRVGHIKTGHIKTGHIKTGHIKTGHGRIGNGRAGGGKSTAADTHAVIEIGVEDAGPGISAIERTKVFDRFYRGSAAGRRGTGTGTGLGLALVAEHVRLMNGEAWVESSPSGGARFVIRLPVLEGDEGPGW
jgi:two-component system, OmpR family, sensor histidine kinase MtrB